MMRLAVLAQDAKGWPVYGDGAGPAEYADAAEVFKRTYEWDAFTVGYSVPSHPWRMTYKAIGLVEIPMVLLLVDIEPEGHAPRTPEWDADYEPRLQQAIADGAFCYETRGGVRLVWALSTPFVIRTQHDAAIWKASYVGALDEVKRRYGIVADAKCKDFTHVQRLPRVTREGVPLRLDMSDPCAMGTWDLKVVDVPEPNRTLTAAGSPSEFGPASPELLERVRSRLRNHGPAIKGKGGDHHTFVACAIVTRGYALSDEESCTVLNEWNATCRPPWDADDLRKKLDNGFNYGSGDVGDERIDWEGDQVVLRAAATYFGDSHTPPGSTPGTIFGPTPLTIGTSTAATTPLTTAKANGLLDLLGTVASETAEVMDDYEALLEFAATKVAGYVGPVRETGKEEPFFQSVSTLFAGDDVPPSWHVPNLLLEGGTAAIGGEAKSAKSWLMTEIAVALATNTPVCGNPKWQPTREVSVAYFYTEDMRDSIKSRVRSLLKGRGLGIEALGNRFHAQPRGKKIDITKLDDCARIIASALLIERQSGIKLGVLALDPLRNIHLRDEDKSGEMVVVFENLKMIGTILGCTIMIVHHSKKESQTGSKRGGQMLRGSSAIHGFLDCALYMSKTRTADDASSITNAVNSETKSGRSAGTFELALKIIDDPRTESAIEARWEVGTKGATAATEDKIDSWRDTACEIVDAFYANKVARNSTAMTTKAIKTAVKGNNDSRHLSLQLACKERWLRQDRKTQTYHITPAGEAFSRERHEAGKAPPVVNVPPSESGHPAANYLQD